MRDIILTYQVKTKFLDKEETLEVIVSSYNDLESKGWTVSQCIDEYIEEYMQDNFCSCSFNEYQYYCDCLDNIGWDGDYKIINRSCEEGGEI